MRKIVFTGPESTGKTTLVQALAGQLHVPYVPEVARTYIDGLNRPYQYEDLLNIAMLQMSEEERVRSTQPNILLCDTDLLTIKIWAEDKFGTCESWIGHALCDRSPEMYFLCAPDFPWQPDPQREDPDRREFLYALYREHIIHSKFRFIELHGSLDKRLHTVLQYLQPGNQQLF